MDGVNDFPGTARAGVRTLSLWDQSLRFKVWRL